MNQKMANQQKEYMSEREAREFLQSLGLHFSRSTFHTIRKSGAIPSYSIGGRVWVRRSELESFLQSTQRSAVAAA